MIAEFLRAFLMAGIPVGIGSYLLIWWGLRAEYFEQTTELKALEKEVGLHAKNRKKSRKKGKRKNNDEGGEDKPSPKFNPVHNKWLTFGGGFYGLVALMTFAIIELGEIGALFAGLGDLLSRIADFDAGLIVEFIVESIKNFVTAITWPIYWMGEIRTGQFWLWFIAAYAGYWLGARAALVRRPVVDSES